MKRITLLLLAIATIGVATSCDKKKEVVEPEYVIVIEAISGTVVYVLDTTMGRDTYYLQQGKKQGLHGGHGYSVAIGCPANYNCVYKVGGHVYDNRSSKFKLRDRD